MSAAEAETSNFEVTGLTPDTVYFVMITATNLKGEGYKQKHGQFIKTMKESMYTPCSLYVWGDNSSSQLGLDGDYDKFARITEDGEQECVLPTLNKQFGSMVYDSAAGNASTLFTVTDQSC